MIDISSITAAKRIEFIGDCVMIQGDCLEVMPQIGKVDAVVTNPPYGIGYKPRAMRAGKKLNTNQTDFNASWKGSKIIMLHSSVDAIDWIVGLASGTDREAKAA